MMRETEVDLEAQQDEGLDHIVNIEGNRWQGVVLEFDDNTGRGMIQGPDNTAIFAHYSCIDDDYRRTLAQDEVVEFDILYGDSCISARNIKRSYRDIYGNKIPKPNNH